MAKKKKLVATALKGYGNVPGYTTAQVTPKASTSAPAAPSFTAAAPPVNADLPVDPTYDRQVGSITKGRDDTIAGLEQQKTAGLLGYGYTATYDPSGKVASLAFDPNNPYSQAALARTVYQQTKTGTNNGMASRGQLYSGALVNAQNGNDTNYNVGESNRQTSLTNFLNGITSNETTVRNTAETDLGTAGGDRVSRAQSNPNYSPSAGGVVGNLPAVPAAKPGVDLSKWVSTEYTNSNGHKARIYGDGHKEVLVNGVWKMA